MRRTRKVGGHRRAGKKKNKSRKRLYKERMERKRRKAA